MRDKHKERVYFEQQIAFIRGEIIDLEDSEFVSQVTNWEAYYSALSNYYKRISCLLYSSGEPKSTIFPYFKKSLQYFIRLYKERTGIANIIDYLSLAVLFDEHKSEFIDDIRLLLDKYNDLADRELVETDDFISILFHYLLTGEVKAFKAYYEYLNMIGNDFESVQKAQGFWYYSHSDAPWYNSHKYDNRGYVGYWCFDTAALCKMRGILDPRLQDLDYFPYDLLIEKRTP